MMKQNENEMNFSVPLEIIKASEIEPKEVKWLWYPYIPFGKVTLLQGDPGDGKSKLMLSIAALLSKGEPLPFTETEENEPTVDESIINRVLRFGTADIREDYLTTIRETAAEYVGEIFRILREREYNPALMRLHVLGGGSCLVRNFGAYDADRVTIYEDICATAKGYEFLCEQALHRGVSG